MKKQFGYRWRTALCGLGLMAMALSSHALTLGRIRGAAWIGQPLDLTVSVELDPATPGGALCQDVEVFYADSRQDAARVRTTLEPTAQANVVNLRIFSAALIDEPVVAVSLRAGCGTKTARRYVLLADYPGESASAASSRALTPVAPQVPTITVVEAPAAAPSLPITGTAGAVNPVAPPLSSSPAPSATW